MRQPQSGDSWYLTGGRKYLTTGPHVVVDYVHKGIVYYHAQMGSNAWVDPLEWFQANYEHDTDTFWSALAQRCVWLPAGLDGEGI